MSVVGKLLFALILISSLLVGCPGGGDSGVQVVVAAARLPSHLALEQILVGLHPQCLDLLLPATTIIPSLNLLSPLPMGNFVIMDTK